MNTTEVNPDSPQRHPKADAARERAADRIAHAMRKTGLRAPDASDDAAWAALARNLGTERARYVPSLDTRQLIHERLADCSQ